MTKGGFVWLVLMLFGIGGALYYFADASPLGNGANDAMLMKALDDQKTQAALRSSSSSDMVSEDDL